jgi:RecJ-like exonuclease
MSDTPETDSLCTEHPKGTSAYIMELIDLCRKMERERNEAAQAESKLDALVEHHTRMIIAHAQEVDALNELVDRLMPKEVTEPPIKNCRKCCGHGQVEIQSGPYMRECPECNGTGKQNNQPKP